MNGRTARGPSERRQSLGRALLETTALYGLIGWIYVAMIAATDTDSLNDRLIRWLPLRIDTAGTVSFALSALSFLVLNTRYPHMREGRSR